MFPTAAALMAVSLVSGAAEPIRGPYRTEFKTLKNPKMDATSHLIDMFYPVDPRAKESKPFRFISYAHGFGGGAFIDPFAYFELLGAMSSFGYVIASMRACNIGCIDDLTSLPGDPPAFAHYYKQQLHVIDWAKTIPDDIFKTVNFTGGVGVAGHSMGGQATLFSSSYRNASEHGITAAVMHHAYTHEYPGPTVPFLAMTGSSDTTAPPDMTYSYYSNPSANRQRGLVERAHTGHQEPTLLAYNPYLAQFSAAWFKIHLDKTPVTREFNFTDMIYGTGETSLCTGGDGEMTKCEVHS